MRVKCGGSLQYLFGVEAGLEGVQPILEKVWDLEDVNLGMRRVFPGL